MPITHAQQQAISARGEDLLLAAAAGSGKTFTLVERILSLIRGGANVDEMLIVTFTRSAAADMKDKLITELSKRAGDDLNLISQLRRVEYSNIQTIDAFCAELIRTYFEAAGVDPLFRVPDEAELSRVADQALKDALEDAYQQNFPGLEQLHFGRGVKGVSSLVMKLFYFAENRPDPEAWLWWALPDEPDGAQISAWFDELCRAAKRELESLLAQLSYAEALCASPDGPLAYAPAIVSDREQLESALGADGYTELQRALGCFAPARLASIRKKELLPDSAQAMIEQVKAIRAAVKKSVGAIQAELEPEDALAKDVHMNQPALAVLRRLVIAFRERFIKLKAEKSLLSFSDIANRSLVALCNDSVAEAVRDRFAYIFVDEYQDVSGVQQALIDRIRRGNNVFMVGDVKQSIYRFRQAEPELFLGVYERFSRGDGGRLIALKQNFRSRPGVLTLVNSVFERVMSGEHSDIQYDENARLYPGAKFEGADPPTELYLLTGGDEQRNSRAQVECEGQLIASRIVEIMRSEQYFDRKADAFRPFRWRDFAVLLRHRANMQQLERALADAGIPVFADINKGYLDAQCVQIAKSLLTVIENRRRDSEYLAVLSSPIGAFTSAELATVRARAQVGSFRDAALRYMAECDDALAERLKSLDGKLERWRVLSMALPLTELIDTALRESGYYSACGRQAGGAQQQANLDLLITYAADYEAAEVGGLTGFLTYMLRIEQSKGDMGAAHALGEGDDVVRLITVHKSKGLEYPVVIAADLGHGLGGGRDIDAIGTHKQLGCALAMTDMELGSRRYTLGQLAIKKRQELEDVNEEMRVLYVLLTRAIDRLILVGSVKDISKAGSRYMIAASGSVVPSNYLDVLVPAVLRAGGIRLFEAGEAEVRLSDLLPDGEGNGSASARRVMDAARLRARIIEGELPQVEVAVDGAAEQTYDAELTRKIAERIDWQYPHKNEVLLPLKLTVSGLARELIGPASLQQVSRRPKFLSSDGLTNTERGTLTHQALMALDLDAVRELTGAALDGNIAAQLDSMLLTGKLMTRLEPKLVCDFIRSGVGRRMLASGTVRREWPFNLRLPMSVALGVDADSPILVQGVIDCCFIEDGEWVLLDYKTDRGTDIDALIARYAPQLSLYARALDEITGIRVKQKLMCLLASGVAVPI